MVRAKKAERKVVVEYSGVVTLRGAGYPTIDEMYEFLDTAVGAGAGDDTEVVNTSSAYYYTLGDNNSSPSTSLRVSVPAGPARVEN